MDERRLGARLSDEAADGWHQFADLHGVSVSALLEAFGRALAAAVEGREPRLAEVVDEARVIDTERRKRPGPRRR